MNPGPVEEAGATARSMVDALKSNPVVLGLVLVILMLIGLVFFIAHKSTEFREAEFTMIMMAQKEVQALLSRCVVPDRP